MKAATFVILILSVALFISIGITIISIQGSGLRIEKLKNEMRTVQDDNAVKTQAIKNRDDIMKKIKMHNAVRNHQAIAQEIRIWEGLK